MVHEVDRVIRVNTPPLGRAFENKNLLKLSSGWRGEGHEHNRLRTHEIRFTNGDVECLQLGHIFKELLSRSGIKRLGEEVCRMGTVEAKGSINKAPHLRFRPRVAAGTEHSESESRKANRRYDTSSLCVHTEYCRTDEVISRSEQFAANVVWDSVGSVTMSILMSRRDAMKSGSMIAVGLMTPRWLSAITATDMVQTAKGGKKGKDTILVVCQMSGGNDGLNTVVPYADPTYHKLRPTLGFQADKVLKINEQLGLHPAMAGFHKLYQAGKVAVIQGVGYPKANRSHFKSMDIWHAASPELKYANGWLGRYFDAMMAGGPLSPVYGLGLSTEKPRALVADKASIPCFASLADIQSMVGDPDMEKLLRQIQTGASDPNAKIIQQANNSAFDAMAFLRDRLKNYEPKQDYGDHAFGQGFKQIAKLLATSDQTRVVYFSTGGFDTHARQSESHEKLLGGFSQAIAAFQSEMEAVGMADRVVVLVFSEFGRRSYENASGGTDHGAAAPMFLIGKKVKGGLYGPLPNLQDLDDGDLKFGIDFRQVYASTLESWMGAESSVILGSEFQNLPVF